MRMMAIHWRKVKNDEYSEDDYGEEDIEAGGYYAYEEEDQYYGDQDQPEMVQYQSNKIVKRYVSQSDDKRCSIINYVNITSNVNLSS